MTDSFIHENFLLQSPAAQELYHNHAADLPIIDYHCHLPAAEIACDQRWENIAQIWLGADHYKWRLMRTAGIDESFITGGASDKDKFIKYAQAMPAFLRNPVYHWSQMELANCFGVNELLTAESAESIWEACNAKLAEPDFSARNLIKKSKVEIICTTDDPVDDLSHHKAIAADSSFTTKVLPTFRPDKAHQTANTPAFNAWVDKLAEAADLEIGKSYERFIEALDRRHEYFDQAGCQLSDHGLGAVNFERAPESEIAMIFTKLRNGKSLSEEQQQKFQTAVLLELMELNAKRNWTQQIHFGVLRNNCTRMFELAGADTGFDSIGDWSVAACLCKLLDSLEQKNALTRTVIYNANPADNAAVATLIGNFQQGPVAGKIQMGSAWWFSDHIRGMTDQIDNLSSMGLLSCFVGMLTDSRSFLSYARHEYFRRLLCNILADDMNAGLIPNDFKLVGDLVQKVSYHNANTYFQWRK